MLCLIIWPHLQFWNNTPFQDDYAPLEEYEPASAKSGEDDEIYLIRAQGLPYSCTEEDVLNFFAGNLILLTGLHGGTDKRQIICGAIASVASDQDCHNNMQEWEENWGGGESPDSTGSVFTMVFIQAAV